MFKKRIKVLVVGKNGGRTHALLLKLSQSPIVKELYCFPGCEGFKNVARLVSVNEKQIYQFAKDKAINLVVISSEEDLQMADRFRENGINVFGPCRKGAELEASKIKAKNFMARHGILTPRFFIANTPEEAFAAIDAIGNNVVVKADGFAKGKGVGVFSNKKEAKDYAKWLLEGGLGSAGRKLVIEERLFGNEASVIAIVCGKNYYLLPIMQDAKPVFDGDQGPNTGGTGVWGPADKIVPPHTLEKIRKEIIEPTMQGLKKEKIDYRGALYFGIMKTLDSKVWLLEYNARFGDPEMEDQVLLIDDDFAAILYYAAMGKIYKKNIAARKGYAVCVAAMAENYPEKPVTGDVITGLESIIEDENHAVFHANTVKENGVWKTAGGRVLAFVAFAETLEKATEEVYKMIRKVHFRGMHFRKDIGQKGLEAKN